MTRLEVALAASTVGALTVAWRQWQHADHWRGLFHAADRLAKLHLERARHAGDELHTVRRTDSDLAKALASAAGSLRSAANSFASIRESQAAGHTPRVDHNPELFARRAELAEQTLAAHGIESSPAPATAGRPLISRAVESAPPARPVAGEDPREHVATPNAHGLIHLPKVIAEAFHSSHSEARRLISQGAVHLDGIRFEHLDAFPEAVDGRVLAVGSRRAIRLKTSAPAASDAGTSAGGGVAAGPGQGEAREDVR